ncbi:MAG: class I SAM-dependent methyltransferase [Acidobacteriota bacterium]
MEIVHCPLCHGEDLSLIDRVRVTDLVHLYQTRFGVAVADHFEGLAELCFYNCARCDLGFFSPLLAGSQSFYQQLNHHPWYYLEEKSEYRTVAALIPRGAAVLDVGCGEGKFARSIPGCEYVGLEMNLAGQLSREDDRPLILPELIAEHSRSRPASYDFVCSFQVLEHVVDVHSFIEDCLKCLRPGGRLIISVPAADSFISRTVNGVLNMPPHHLTWWTDQALGYVAKSYDLILESIVHEPLERLHYRRYAFNWAWSGLRRRFRLIDRTLAYRVGSLFILPFAAIRWLMLLCISPDSIYGHSVVAVYRKGTQE